MNPSILIGELAEEETVSGTSKIWTEVPAEFSWLLGTRTFSAFNLEGNLKFHPFGPCKCYYQLVNNEYIGEPLESQEKNTNVEK